MSTRQFKPDMKNNIFKDRNNHLTKEFQLENNARYVWILDNTYSRLISKTVKTQISVQTNSPTDSLLENLPFVQLLKNKIPKEIFDDLNDANNSYVIEHFRQSAIMFRSALESAIKIKIKQESGLTSNLLYNSQGDELPLSKKLDNLLTNNVITK